MMEIIKKILGLLMGNPAFANLFKKSIQTGRVDPFDAVSAISTLSPSANKCVNNAINTVQNGGNVADVAKEAFNMGEIEIFGHKANTKEMIGAFEKAGKGWGILANILKSIPNQPEEKTVEFGNIITDMNNWQDIVKQ